MDEFTFQVLRFSLPLLLACLSETVAERGGIVNLGLEGTMLLGAFVAYVVAAGEPATSLGLAIGAATLAGMSAALLLGVWVVLLRANQIVAGTALHFLLFGATGLWFERHMSSASVVTFAELPGLGPWIPYLVAALLTAGVTLWLSCSRSGLLLRAAGENPAALAAAGESPARSRWLALLVAGSLAGLAGATLTTVLTGQFVEGMTSGRGFLALSLVLLARWNPLGALLASLLLGLAFTAEVRLTTWAVLRESERQDFLVFALRCLPYLVTVTVLAGLGPGRRPPAALGQPH